MYQTVTRGPMQLPTSFEPWLEAKDNLKVSFFNSSADIHLIIKYLSAPKQAVSNWRGLNTLFTSSSSSSISFISCSTFNSSSCLSVLPIESGRDSLFWLWKHFFCFKKKINLVLFVFCIQGSEEYLAEERCLWRSSSVCPLIERWRDSWRDSWRSSLITWTVTFYQLLSCSNKFWQFNLCYNGQLPDVRHL